jgi:hypothetical protein
LRSGPASGCGAPGASFLTGCRSDVGVGLGSGLGTGRGSGPLEGKGGFGGTDGLRGSVGVIVGSPLSGALARANVSIAIPHSKRSVNAHMPRCCSILCESKAGPGSKLD